MFIKVFLKNDEYDLHAKKEKVFVATKRADKTIKSFFDDEENRFNSRIT